MRPIKRFKNELYPCTENQILVEEFKKGWKHFLDCIDFAKGSHLDAEAIRFMNEMPNKIIQALLD